MEKNEPNDNNDIATCHSNHNPESYINHNFNQALVYDRNRNFGRNFGQLGRNISAESFGQPAETPKQAKTSFFANFWQFFPYFLQIFFYKY